MPHLLNRFNLHAAKWNGWTAFNLLFIWMLVLACVISSIVAQPFDRKQRIFWIAVVILLPGIGTLAYLPFAFRKEDLPQIFQRKSKHSRSRFRKSSGSEDSDA